MSPALNSRVLTLLEAQLSLYPEVDGVADTGNPVWQDACAERLTLAPQFLTVETWPTGVARPRRRNLAVTHHVINLGRLWNTPLETAEPSIGPGRFQLDVSWTEEETGRSLRRSYQGVTVEADAVESGQDRMEFHRGLTLIAETMIESVTP